MIASGEVCYKRRNRQCVECRCIFLRRSVSQYMCANREVKVNLSKTMPDVQWLSALTSSQRDASR